MVGQYLACALIVIGAVVFVYIYHVRVARIPLEERTQVIDWPIYRWVDLYLKVSSIGITITAILINHRWLLEIHDNLWGIYAGLFVTGMGIALFIAAIVTLDRQFSDAHQSRLPTELVEAGPYLLIRHPIYTANLVLTLGLMITSGSAWLAMNLMIVGIYYSIMVPMEERFLVQAFPEYERYRERTGAIFPRLWAR